VVDVRGISTDVCGHGLTEPDGVQRSDDAVGLEHRLAAIQLCLASSAQDFRFKRRRQPLGTGV
jgi:hypothetical protein